MEKKKRINSWPDIKLKAKAYRNIGPMLFVEISKMFTLNYETKKS